MLRKIRGVANQSHSASFRPIALKGIEHGVPISESLLYSFKTSRMKIGGVTLATPHLRCQKDPLPPFAMHILNRLDMGN